MIAIVCGGRNYADAERVKKVLDAAVQRLGLETIIEGGGTGADALAWEWAKARGDVSWIHCPADWDGWAAKGSRDSAGPARNAMMLAILMGGENGMGRAVIAFPSSGPGTKNMLALANSQKAAAAHVKVIMVTASPDAPRVWNRHHGNAPNDAIYCGRGTPYGNPFEVGKDGTRDEVCDKFDREILPAMDVSALRGRHLVCSCAPQRCHCDGILRKANAA